MTPKDCRAKEDQYFQWVQDAQTSYERDIYLKLARAWLEAALFNDDVRPLCRLPLVFRLTKLSGSFQRNWSGPLGIYRRRQFQPRVSWCGASDKRVARWRVFHLARRVRLYVNTLADRPNADKRINTWFSPASRGTALEEAEAQQLRSISQPTGWQPIGLTADDLNRSVRELMQIGVGRALRERPRE